MKQLICLHIHLIMYIKSTLLVFLSFFVSSVCFGKVVRVVFNTVYKKQQDYSAEDFALGKRSKDHHSHIKFTSDHPLPISNGIQEDEVSSSKEYMIRFKSNYEPKIDFESNENELKGLKLTLQYLLGVNDTNFDFNLNNPYLQHVMLFSLLLEDLFIKHGYQLTFKKETVTNEYLYSWYFYKPD